MTDDRPFLDAAPEGGAGAFTLPFRKWRELLFVGAMRPDADGFYRRDPARPLPPMRDAALFAAGRRFRVEHLPETGDRPPDRLNPRRRGRSRVRLTPAE